MDISKSVLKKKTNGKRKKMNSIYTQKIWVHQEIDINNFGIEKKSKINVISFILSLFTIFYLWTNLENFVFLVLGLNLSSILDSIIPDYGLINFSSYYEFTTKSFPNNNNVAAKHDLRLKIQQVLCI